MQQKDTNGTAALANTVLAADARDDGQFKTNTYADRQ